MGDGTRTFGGRLESCACPFCYFTNFYLRLLIIFHIDSLNGFKFQNKIYYSQYLLNAFGPEILQLNGDVNELVEHIALD